MAVRSKKKVPPKKTREGRLIVVSGASGSGKTSLCRRLVETVLDTETSVSYTTREPRLGEIAGVHYHFVDDTTFDRMIARREFAEWARVHNNRYGTSIAFVKRKLAGGIDVICDIDVQGGLALRKRFKGATVLIFVLPPNMVELERRLRTRATDSDIVIQRRLNVARKEQRVGRGYDYILVNDDFVKAAGTLADIVRAERQKAPRMKPLLPKELF